MLKYQLRTIKYRDKNKFPFRAMSKDKLLYNKEIIERRMKERMHNSRQTKRDRLTLAKIDEEINKFHSREKESEKLINL